MLPRFAILGHSLALLSASAALALPAQPIYTPSRGQPLPAWQPGRKVEPGTGDSGPLKLQRLEPRLDMRLPTGFDGVYELNKTDIFGHAQTPGGATESVYMRMDGGLMAVFPRSVYRESRGGLIPQVPPGTIFYLGQLPPGLVGAGKVQPEIAPSPAPSGATPTAAAPPAIAEAPALFSTSGLGIPQDPALFYRPASITIWKDDAFRKHRLSSLLSRLGPDEDSACQIGGAR